MSLWFLGGHSSRRRLKIAVPALGLMMAAAIGIGPASAWTQPNTDGDALKLDALAGSAANFREVTPERPEQRPIFAALDQSMRQTMASYNYDTREMQDPFLPIKEVRNGLGGTNDDRLAFTQLKLVAIAARVDGSGAMASFEDGAGVSYIMHEGDQFGRSKGRVTSIEPSQVTIVEPPHGSSSEPIKTIMKLNVLENSMGLIRHEQETAVQ